MRMCKIFGIVFAMVLLCQSCKTRQTAYTQASSPTTEEESNIGHGLALSGTGFAWQRSDLPLCYRAREGVKVFLWQEQVTLKCLHSNWTVQANNSKRSGGKS